MSVDQNQERLKVEDTKIAQKINAAHREAFHQKFPSQTEHIMRLIAERLQQALRKDQDVCLPPKDIDHLSQALYNVYQIYKEINHA